MRREGNQSDQIEHDEDKVRTQCATAPKINEAGMIAQYRTLQNVTETQFSFGRSFCGRQPVTISR